jgi:CHAT domain-containing protein/tetratricopeptide (TPR) repeat protein
LYKRLPTCNGKTASETAVIQPAPWFLFDSKVKQGLVPYLLLLLLLAQQEAAAQCMPSAEYISQVNAIRESTSGNLQKIRELQALQQTFPKCHAVKDSAYARIVHRLGDLYRETGDLEKGIAYTKEAVRINAAAMPGAERSYLTHSYYNLGLYYKLLYQFADAHRYFDSCIFIGTQYPGKTAIVLMAFEQKAFTYYRTGDYQKAIEIADQGMLLAKTNFETVVEASLLAQKAQSQIELDRLPGAEANIGNAIQILEQADLPEYLATAYSINAHLLERKKEFQSAIRYYKKAFQLNQEIENWAQCSGDLMDLGYCYNYHLKNEEKALACFNESIRFAQKAGDAYQTAGLYNNIGSIYWSRRQYRLALQYFQQGLTALPIRFQDAALQSNPPAATLKFVSNDYFVLTLLANKGETLIDLYRIQNDKSLLQAALKAYEAADQTIDLMRWKQQGELSKFFWRTKTKKIYEKAIEASYLSGSPEKAYFFFEKSRAVLLNDQLNELGAKKYIAPADRTREQALRLRTVSLNQQLQLQPENSAAFTNINRELLQAQNAWEAFIRKLEALYPAYYQYKYNNTVMPLQTVQERLAQTGQALVEYFTGDSVLYILALHAGKTTLLQVPVGGFHKSVSEFLMLCSNAAAVNQRYADFKKLGFALYQQLLAPLQLTATRVVISPDDQFLPFEALLYDTTAPTAYLLKKHAFSYTYSAGLLFRQNSGAATKTNFLGIAPVQYQPDLQQQSLTGADQSLQTIRSYFKEASLLTGTAATKQQFLNTFPQYRIVQIYSHAVADSTGRQPLLYLRDSALFLSQIQMQEGVRTEMIVLSACKTGIGKNIRGEGVFSLARGFAAAGIPATVTTLWQVDSKATFQLTEAFYKYLGSGLPKDEALQKAKLHLMQQGDVLYPLPYYWAGNILLGNADKLTITKSDTSFLPQHLTRILFIAILLSLLVFGFLYRRGQRRS